MLNVNHIVHQIWGLCKADEGKDPPRALEDCSKTWQEHARANDMVYKRWNRQEIEEIVDKTPWKTTFYSLEHWVEQCDFARYILVYLYGGIYSDMDTVCKVCPKIQYKTLTIGLEANVSDDERLFHNLARNVQYCQWTFAADKGHPALLAVITAIDLHTSKTCASVLNRTGPGAFTDAIESYMAYMASMAQNDHILQNAQNDPVEILGIEAFACGQKHSNSPNPSDSRCMVIHTFEGSWKYPSLFRPLVKFLKRF